ncbi:ATP synthase subunit I [[Phormidium ambiguum] IAM M-71]|uniref:ATP synthase subunit I n=1 Tax=[Phormidium ambiguum] IAM M-71 TaxID=454136 RepID=UPI000B0D9354|nr:ATP synthase subunit I [Phormidium ambiguum]
MSDSSHESTTVATDNSQVDAQEEKPRESMQEYYSLQKELYVVTLTTTAMIFVSVWVVYNRNTALNYLLGACTGVVYLRMLAKNVEQLGQQNRSLSKSRFAVFIGLIILATQLSQLQVLPIFLGFLTYKVALLYQMVRALMPSDRR